MESHTNDTRILRPMVHLRLRRGCWILEWSEYGKRYRRSIRNSALTEEDAEKVRERADSALRMRGSIRLNFERNRGPKKVEIRAASFDEVKAFLPQLHKQTRNRARGRGI